ncbi:hypothetical protein R5W60_04600 [Brucella pseudintermedia]|uniref:hypothetical protein n=1 Tax=Brucella pseudintermedia TaxID=370111 RepID=UPI00366B3108|nr:hypothetical protein R5W60_04600 [Brucella pseudintermedia]
MPFYEPSVRVQDLLNVAPVEEPQDPSLGETVGAAFRTENIVGSYLSSRGETNPYDVEDGFNAIDYVKDDPDYAPYVEQFGGVFNRKAADALKLQIKREEQDRRTLDAAGINGTIASLAAGVLDLPTVFSVGGGIAGAGRTVFGTAVRAGVGAGIDATVSEAGLQLTQRTRTGEESAYNIGGSVLLGGALGTLVGRYLSNVEASALSRKIEEQGKGFAEADNAVFGNGAARSAGAAAVEQGPTHLKDEALIKRLWGVRSQDPLIRSQLSDFDSTRQTVRQLAETPLEYAENAQGVATEIGGSVETRMKMWQAPLADTLQQVDTIYAKYFHNTPDPTGWQRRLAPMRSEMQRITGGDKLTFKQFKEEVGRAAFSGDEHVIPEIAEAAKAYRRIDDAMKRAAIEARLFPEDIKLEGDVSHLFRMYNKDKIAAYRSDFARILNDYFITKRDAAAKIGDAENVARKAGAKADAAAKKAQEFSRLSDDEVKDLVEETIDTILGNADGRIPYDSIVSGPRGPLKERLLRIESKKIQEFLNTDIEEVLHAQVRTMSADVELAKKFGSVDMAEQIRKINDEANRKISAVDGMKDKDGKPATPEAKAKERSRLDRARKSAVRDIEAMRDRLRGQYALPSNPDGIVLRAGRVARNLNYLRLLGGMTLSAFPDMAGIVLKHGLTSTFRDGFAPLVSNMKAVKLAGAEVKAAGTALDMILDSRAMSIAEIGDQFGRGTAFERAIKSAGTRFGVVSLMAPWNAAMKQFSGIVVMTNLLRASEKVAKGQASPKEIRKLAAAGINSDLAERITKQFSKYGETQDGVLLAKAADWDDRLAKEAFRAAVVRDVDRIIVTPGQDKPLWMSTELGKTVGQFKSFQLSSMQRVALAGLQQRDAETLSGVVTALGLGAFAYAAKQFTAGRDLSDNPMVWAVEATDKSGLTGWLMEVNAISEKATRGRVGASAVTGEQISRYASRNVIGSFLGPTPGAISDIFQVSGSVFAGDTSKADLNKMRQLMPFQNLFWLRYALDKVENSTGSAIGLEDRSKR